jgi:hypothetical protein
LRAGDFAPANTVVDTPPFRSTRLCCLGAEWASGGTEVRALASILSCARTDLCRQLLRHNLRDFETRRHAACKIPPSRMAPSLDGAVYGLTHMLYAPRLRSHSRRSHRPHLRTFTTREHKSAMHGVQRPLSARRVAHDVHVDGTWPSARRGPTALTSSVAASTPTLAPRFRIARRRAPVLSAYACPRPCCARATQRPQRPTPTLSSSSCRTRAFGSVGWGRGCGAAP